MHGVAEKQSASNTIPTGLRIQQDFRWSRPHGYIESFKGKLRDECLNANQFLSIDDARSKIEAWRTDYNLYRPHSGLGNVSPAEWLKRVKAEDQRAVDFSF